MNAWNAPTIKGRSSHIEKQLISVNCRFLDEDRARVMARRANPVPNPAGLDSRITFTEYHTYDEIAAYVEEVAQLEDWATSTFIGQSYEGRDTAALELTKAGDSAVANIFIQAGMLAD